MNPVLLKYQLVACGVLSGILLLEWGGAGMASSQLRDILEQTIKADYQSEPLPGLKRSKLPEAGFNSIVERPLFIEGRKPLPDDAEDSSEAKSDMGQLDDWALIGIYNKDKKNKKPVALFRNQKEAKKFIKLNEDQTISGWQLTEIQYDRVILQLAGQQKTVMLRKPREQSKVPMPPRHKPPVAKSAVNNSPETKPQ